jgi:hypothetical protein
MKRILLLILLASSSAFASELELPVGARASLRSRKPIHEIVVRDPSLVRVIVADGVASLEGKKSGVTAVTVEYADGQLERALVVVGDGTGSTGMSAERAETVDLRQSAKAQTKASKAEPKQAPKLTSL